MTTAQDRPLYPQGHLSPVADEIDAVDLPVTSRLPPELVDRYFRNGPNPLARVGRPNRYLYAVSEARQGSGRNAVLSYDLDRGGVEAHDLAPDLVAGEAVFIPSAAAGRTENDGWLISITTTRDGGASEMLVLDVTDLAAAPVARVTLPRGVPAGFHGARLTDPADPV